MVVAACARSQPPTPTPSPPALVAAPSTVAPAATPAAAPTEAPPTKKPRKTKKPKPTPTPETWSPAYRSHVCNAIGYLADSKAHVDAVAARFGVGDGPGSRTEAFTVVQLAGQASGEIGAAKAWPPGDNLKALLSASASGIGQGAGRWLDGFTSLDHDVMGTGMAAMQTGADQLAQARIELAALATTYGPAGC